MSENTWQVDELLRQASLARASDVHFTVELPPMLRIDGELKPVPGLPVLKPPDTERVLLEVLTELQLAEYRLQGSVDFSRSLPGVGRFRVNAYRQRHAAALALRLIPIGIPSLGSLGLPRVVSELARKHAGL
ncbi:MAG: type IV pili twitching motility protein PilT, partial [Thermaerobacter sp.]|nr:type IV pili twitching motility protein PilT [Thermaerobacter sp.]